MRTYFAMRLVAIESLGQNQYHGLFALTMKGITRQVTVPFTIRQMGDQGVFSGSFTVKRLDFGVGSPSWLLADQVLIHIKLDVTRC